VSVFRLLGGKCRKSPTCVYLQEAKINIELLKFMEQAIFCRHGDSWSLLPL